MIADGLTYVLHGLRFEVGKIVNFCRVLFYDGEHLIFVLAIQVPFTLVANVFACEVCH